MIKTTICFGPLITAGWSWQYVWSSVCKVETKQGVNQKFWKDDVLEELEKTRT